MLGMPNPPILLPVPTIPICPARTWIRTLCTVGIHTIQPITMPITPMDLRRCTRPPWIPMPCIPEWPALVIMANPPIPTPCILPSPPLRLTANLRMIRTARLAAILTLLSPPILMVNPRRIPMPPMRMIRMARLPPIPIHCIPHRTHRHLVLQLTMAPPPIRLLLLLLLLRTYPRCRIQRILSTQPILQIQQSL